MKAFMTGARKYMNILLWAGGLGLAVAGGWAGMRELLKRSDEYKIVEAIIPEKEEVHQADMQALHAEKKFNESTTRAEYLHMFNDNKDPYEAWMAQFDSLQEKTALQKLLIIDSAVDSSIAFASDFNTYGEYDYCAAPVQTIKMKKGDETDMAILKSAALERAGFPLKDIFVSIVSTTEDMKVQSTVLAVDTTGAGKPEDLIILESDGAAKVTAAGDQCYTYHVGINKDGIRYITPPPEVPTP